MRKLVQERAKAISLRKQGLTYNEILRQVPVAKSSLSLWLNDLPLTKLEKHLLSKRKDSNTNKGRIRAAAAHHQNRLAREKERVPSIIEFFNKHEKEPLFHLGVGLYWAEGAKNSGGVMFTNSDEKMIQVMIEWFERYTEYSRLDLRYRLYIHKPYAHENCERWWSEKLLVPLTSFTKTSFKPTSKGIKIRQNYKGCLRIEVPRSTVLLHKIKIWTDLIVVHHHKQ